MNRLIEFQLLFDESERPICLVLNLLPHVFHTHIQCLVFLVFSQLAFNVGNYYIIVSVN